MPLSVQGGAGATDKALTDQYGDSAMDTDFEVATITIEQFVNDPEARSKAEAWYWKNRLVHLDYSCPYIIVKGEVEDVPPGATLTDW